MNIIVLFEWVLILRYYQFKLNHFDINNIETFKIDKIIWNIECYYQYQKADMFNKAWGRYYE